MKTVFTGLFFSSILPSALLITAVAMLNNYLCDKFMLLNYWKRPPMLGSRLANTTCTCF
jgi:hypothetical protein